MTDQPNLVIVDADAIRYILRHADFDNETFYLDDVGQPKGSDVWDECVCMCEKMRDAVALLEQALIEEFGDYIRPTAADGGTRATRV